MSAATDHANRRDQPATTTGSPVPLAVAEAALLIVHLSVVGGFIRLYQDWSFVGVLAGFTIGAHVLAVTLRRRQVPTAVVVAAALTGAALGSTWLLFPASTAYWLPTGETWDLAVEALRGSRDRFEEVAAPAPVIAGFQLAAGLALYGAVWFADWAAFRLRATVEAVAPATVLFVFGAILGSGRHRFTTAVAFGAAVLLFVACHRALRAQLDHAWLAASPLAGPRAVLRAGAGLAVVGLLGGAVIGPQLPGSEAEAVVRWRSDTGVGGDRSTVSPIVDLRKRLVNQSDTVLFTVRAERRAYWRLTALDVFDGRLWSSSGRFSAADGRLADFDASQVETSRRNRQEFDISSLAAIWAPTAFKARSLGTTSGGLQWDPDSSTLITEADTTSDGLRYEVVSEAPELDAVTLVDRGFPIEDGVIGGRHLALPADFPDVASDLARQVTSGADSRYEQALALQDHFRSGYTYSLAVDSGNGDEALVDFLDSREGYCEQFAGAYAAMARSIGLPARVAVGFTPGDPDPDDPNLYTVRGKHAHAWPEVWFPGVGWVPFEPTPGRGMPDAEDYTGVAAAQDETVPDSTAGSSTTTTTTPSATSAPGSSNPPATAPRNTALVAGIDPDDGGGPSGRTQVAVGVAVLVVLWLTLVLAAPLVRRRGRLGRRGAGRSAAAVLGAWHDALVPVRWLTGLRPRPAETHDEFARRASVRLGQLGADLRELAALTTRASWDPVGATAGDAEEAAARAAALHDAAVAYQGRVDRIRRRLSWREAFDQPRAVTGAA